MNLVFLKNVNYLIDPCTCNIYPLKRNGTPDLKKKHNLKEVGFEWFKKLSAKDKIKVYNYSLDCDIKI